MAANRWTDEKVDQWIGAMLQAGVIAAGLVVLAGGILYLASNGRTPVHYGVFQGKSAAFSGFRPILSGALHLDSRAVIELGILLLIATPVARVVFSIVAFALQRDRIYIMTTLVVLTILLYSLLGAPR